MVPSDMKPEHMSLGARVLVGLGARLPEQMARRLSPSESHPIKRLMLAILEDGIWAFLKSHDPTTRGEAEAWIFSSNEHYLFSFNAICGELGLEASYMRRGIRIMKEELKRGPLARPNDGRIRPSVRSQQTVRAPREKKEGAKTRKPSRWTSAPASAQPTDRGKEEEDATKKKE